MSASISAAARGQRLVAAALAAALLWTASPLVAAGQATVQPPVSNTARVQGPIVGGVALETTTAAGWPLHYDRELAPAVVGQVGAGLEGALSAVPRFSGLPPEALDVVARLLLFMERQPGEEIVRQGSQGSVGDGLFIVGRGEVEVVVADEDGQERIVNQLGEGDYFGEISFLRRARRIGTIRARTPTELHILRRLDFDHLLAHFGEDMLTQMEETARERIDETRAKLAVLSA